jgi:hypothetical protein
MNKEELAMKTLTFDCMRGVRSTPRQIPYQNTNPWVGEDGSVYEGETTNGKPHGKGKYTYANGNVYEGDFANGKKHGKGKLTFANGKAYEIDFVDDEPQGEMEWLDTGEFLEEDAEPKTISREKITFANGAVYEGDIADGKFHGKGKYTYANGDVYEGDFVKGNFHGKGKYTYPDGLVKEGTWSCGGFQGKCEVYRHQISPRYDRDDYQFNNEYEKKFDEDFRELFTQRLKEDRNFGCELWSALANVGWYHADDIEEEHECGRSFRGAGSLISDMYGDGDYVDWYCSGPYITVSDYIATQMASKGWRYELYGEPGP